LSIPTMLVGEIHGCGWPCLGPDVELHAYLFLLTPDFEFCKRHFSPSDFVM
jgi:hypothetical protein